MPASFIHIEPFRPAWGTRSPHAQTIIANLARSKNGIYFHRQRLNTPDGDFVDLDFAYIKRFRWLWRNLGKPAPIVLVLHGLEGSARRSYTCELYRQLATWGIRAIGLNFRSCSGELNRTTRMYHSGATWDVRFVLDWLSEQYPNVPLGLAGFSLGANVTLKFMGEDGKGVQTAVAISPPFDLASGVVMMDSGGGRPYKKRLLNSLKQKARAKEKQLSSIVNVNAILAADTFYDFDNAWAPIHGYASADDYYAQCSSRHFLADICAPTLILRALDDPFFSPDDVPYDLLAANERIQVHLPQHGGHVGFVEGTLPGTYRYWAERQAARFFAAVMNRLPAQI
jgi:uncharacterized protein